MADIEIHFTRDAGTDDVPLPRYMSEHASGMDVCAAVDEPVTLEPGHITLIPTGLRIAIPPGYEVQVRPRSGLALKHGITVVNWPLRRLILSVGANRYASLVTGMRVKDSTGGFKCFRRTTLEMLPLERIKSDGYSFQIEMNYHCWKRKLKIKEIPIMFVDRQVGVSKMSKRIIVEAIWMVWALRFRRIP